ncbi:MAG: DUF4382 domain-containing protein [Candidatus Riflebacteria bacterium]|nr:DUF4382 domain-containing protein [Candidatus Riflebacteria bacterium]
MNRLKLLTLMLVIVLPLLTGCFGGGSGSSNPVGVSMSNSAPTMDSSSSQLLACKFTKKLDRKYTFAKSNYKIDYSMREGVKKGISRLKLLFLSPDNADDILITFNKLEVKSDRGVKTTFAGTRSISLTGNPSENNISQVLADLELAPGKYKEIVLYVSSAKLKDKDITYKLIIPSKKFHLKGNFEIKNGFSTYLTIHFKHRMLRTRLLKLATMIPVVKISSELRPIDTTPEVTDGDITGTVENMINSQKLAGVTVVLDGTAFSAVTDANGAFSFAKVPKGIYSLKASHPDYLDYSLSVSVEAGQIAAVNVQINPAVIHSSVGNTGWFAEIYPLADANGEYAEVALETPINIDFVSLAFVKAEMKFTAEYYANGSSRCLNYLSSTQQVSAVADLGSWWAGNAAVTGSYLGEFYCTTSPGTTYTVDVTEMVRSNPSSSYFMASKNIGLTSIRMTNVQLSVYYR